MMTAIYRVSTDHAALYDWLHPTKGAHALCYIGSGHSTHVSTITPSAYSDRHEFVEDWERMMLRWIDPRPNPPTPRAKAEAPRSLDFGAPVNTPDGFGLYVDRDPDSLDHHDGYHWVLPKAWPRAQRRYHWKDITPLQPEGQEPTCYLHRGGPRDLERGNQAPVSGLTDEDYTIPLYARPQ